MTTLYRKYRPQTFEEIVGQDHIITALRAALEKKRVAHAYLFYGARGTGKTTTARVLAQNLGATKLDVIEIDAASNRGIDDIRALRDNVALSPTQGKYKIYIIDEVHMLTKEAFAALLKTLEEPVPHAVFILATTELHKVPATILSRCQVYRFRRATPEEMNRRLSGILEKEKREVTPEALDFLIKRSDGCYRDAESLLGQVLTWREGKVEAADLADFLGLPAADLLKTFLEALTVGQAAPALEIVEKMYTEGIDGDQFLHEAIRAARDEALRLAMQSQLAAPEARALARLPLIIRALLTAVQDLAYVPEPKIALQLAVLSVATAAGSKASVAAPPQAAPKPVPALRRTAPAQKSGDVARVHAIWSSLIAAVKEQNPVASTFLRAMEPVAFDGAAVVIRVQYPLHRNFFERPETRAMLDEMLGKQLGLPVTTRLQLEEPNASSGIAPHEVRKQEEDLYAAAKEVFAQG